MLNELTHLGDVCRFCRASSKFVDAHVLPFWTTQHLHDGEPALQVRGSQPQRPIRHPRGFWDPKILCEVCESSYFDRPDKQGRKVLLKTEWVEHEVRAGGRLAQYIVPGQDGNGFRLFALSLVWRCGASKRHEFKGVELGYHLDSIAERLRSRDPGDWREYGVMLHKYESSKFNGEEVSPLLASMFPSTHRLYGYRVVRVSICGFAIFVFIDHRYAPLSAQPFLIKPDQPFQVNSQPWTNSVEFTSLMQMPWDAAK